MKLLNIILAALIAFTMLALMGCPPQQTPTPDDVDEPVVETPATTPETGTPAAPSTSLTPADSSDASTVVDSAGNSVIIESPDGDTTIRVSPDGSSTIITDDGEPTLCFGTECGAAGFGLGVRKTYWYEVEK